MWVWDLITQDTETKVNTNTRVINTESSYNQFPFEVVTAVYMQISSSMKQL